MQTAGEWVSEPIRKMTSEQRMRRGTWMEMWMDMVDSKFWSLPGVREISNMTLSIVDEYAQPLAPEISFQNDCNLPLHIIPSISHF